MAFSNLSGNSHQEERIERNNMRQHRCLLVAGVDLLYIPNSKTKLGFWASVWDFRRKHNYFDYVNCEIFGVVVSCMWNSEGVLRSSLYKGGN